MKPEERLQQITEWCYVQTPERMAKAIHKAEQEKDALESQLKEVKEENRQLHILLGECSCPHCDGSGGIQISEDESEQCQWCYIKNTILK